MIWSRFGEALKAAATKIFVHGSAVGASRIDRSGIPGFGGSAKPPHDEQDFPDETQFPK
jgi:hypothetical protein